METGGRPLAHWPDTKAHHEPIDSFAEIATARIALEGHRPADRRQAELPTSITLKVLHDIVQATMAWMDYHLWQFVIDGRTYGLPNDEDWGTAPRRRPPRSACATC